MRRRLLNTEKGEMMKIRRARKTIAKAFQKSPDFRRGYVDNVACILMDELDIHDEDRDKVADRIIRLIFES